MRAKIVVHTNRIPHQNVRYLIFAGRQKFVELSVVGLTTVHAQFNAGRQQIDENGYDQYGKQVDPAMIPDRLDSANVEVKGLPPTLYLSLIHIWKQK